VIQELNLGDRFAFHLFFRGNFALKMLEKHHPGVVVGYGGKDISQQSMA
jgi:hypothetical protein